jgi:hypothetical protein
MANFREVSKQNFTSDNTIEHINAGSLQRIADATELMAKNYLQLQSDRDLYKRWYNESSAQKAKLYRQISALRGVITKLKNNRKPSIID